MYSLRREDIVSGITLVKSTYSPTQRDSIFILATNGIEPRQWRVP